MDKMIKNFYARLLVGMFLILCLSVSKGVDAAGKNIASGSINNGSLTWVIDVNGNLTVNGSGEFSTAWSTGRAPWDKYRNSIITAKVNLRGTKDASYMFYGCKNLISVDLRGFNTSSVTNMSGMFQSCSSIKTLNLNYLDTSNVQNMNGMFLGCTRLEYLDVYNFDTSNVSNMISMFAKCSNLKTLDLRTFDMSNVSSAGYFIDGCPALKVIHVPKNIKKDIALPKDLSSDKWYLENGATAKNLPTRQTSSIVIEKNAVPDHPKTNVRYIFSDVHIDWYYDYVQYVYINGLMTGIKGTTRFEPNSNITKAQVAQVLYNMENKPGVSNRKVFTQLKDVYEAEWYANAVAWAYNTGVVTGDLNTRKFSPNANVTREQLALMMYRYAKYKNYSTSQTSNFTGLTNAYKVSSWAKDGMKWAVGTGLISGVEKNGVKDLAPQGGASRTQLAAILKRFCDKY